MQTIAIHCRPISASCNMTSPPGRRRDQSWDSVSGQVISNDRINSRGESANAG
jgi:hypothetical protein